MFTMDSIQCADDFGSSEYERVESTTSENLSEFLSLPEAWGLPDMYLAPSMLNLDDLDSVSDMTTADQERGLVVLREKIAMTCLNELGSSHESRKTTPVVQVLPATHMPVTSHTTTPTTGGNTRSKRHTEGRKALFATEDIKRSVESRWQEELENDATRINRVAPSKVVSGGAEESFNVPPNMEETMNHSVYVENEQRRVMGSPLRGSHQGHRSNTSHKSPNSGYINPYHNAPVNISPEYLTRSSTTSHYAGVHPNDLYAAPTNYASMPRAHDLNDWQRIQQQQQLAAQLEQLQITTQTLSSGLPTYSGLHGNTIGMGSTSNSGIGFNDDLGKVEGLIRAKEAILYEKNMIIERQKLEIAHLQNQRREIELQERVRLYSRPLDHSDKLFVKVQECEYETATLRAHIAEITAAKDTEIDTLSKKLGEAEYDLQTLQDSNKSVNQERNRELEDVKRKLVDKDKHCDSLKDKYTKTREKYEKVKKKYCGIERYMEDLPTVEEQNKNQEMIRNLREKEMLMKERITQLEVSLTEARQTIKTKDFEITNMETRQTDIQLESESLQDEVYKLQTALGVANDEVSQSMKLYNMSEIEKLRKDKEKYKQEASQLKQVIESKHQHLKKLQSQHHKSTHNLEERLQQEEDTVTAMRQAVKDKEEELKQYKVSTRDLAAQSQELYEHNLSLQEQKESLERLASTEHLNGSKRLLKELSSCVKDLHSLVQVCEHTVEGEEPNVSALLGLRSTSGLSEHEEEETAPSLESIKGRLKQTRKIRADVDRMRGLLQDKYAQDMGNNCITQ